MSVDTVNEALTKVRLSIRNHKAVWGWDGAHIMTLHCEAMRGYLMEDDVEGFIAATQRMLGYSPDSMTEVLNMLFAEVCGDERATWEQFEAELRRP